MSGGWHEAPPAPDDALAVPKPVLEDALAVPAPVLDDVVVSWAEEGAQASAAPETTKTNGRNEARRIEQNVTASALQRSQEMSWPK